MLGSYIIVKKRIANISKKEEDIISFKKYKMIR
jgi:hypothetical protein